MATPQDAMAQEESAAASAAKPRSASSYWKECSSATAWSKAAWALAPQEISKCTLPSFSADTASCWWNSWAVTGPTASASDKAVRLERRGNFMPAPDDGWFDDGAAVSRTLDGPSSAGGPGARVPGAARDGSRSLLQEHQTAGHGPALRGEPREVCARRQRAAVRAAPVPGRAVRARGQRPVEQRANLPALEVEDLEPHAPVAR